MVFNWFSKRNSASTVAARLRDKVFEGALTPSLYEQGLAEDTVDGRFVMVAIHGSLIMRRLKALDNGGAQLARRLGEAVFDRLDYGLREEGVGDSSIARKVRKLGERYYGIAQALDDAIDRRSSADLLEAVQRNVPAGTRAEPLSDYIVEADSRLAELNDQVLQSGNWNWPMLGQA